MVHELKAWPMYFREVKSGAKPFEVRKNDRNFQIGDEVLLREYCPENYYENGDKADYTGEVCHRKISYILNGGQFGIDADTVVLGLQVI
jgi:hypothetical protein